MRMKQKLFSILALLLMAATGAWAEEQVVYTLDGTQTASNNAYTTAGVVNQGGITWMVTGNTSMNPWRIGGKSLSGVDRSIWSENSLDETVTKVTLEFGTASSITVNSITMTVAGDAEFSDVIDTKAVTFSAYNTVDVTPTEGKEWKNAYYRFVFNVTVSGSSNKYFQLKSIKFYNDPDAQQQGGGTDPQPGGGSTEPVASTYSAALAEGTEDAANWKLAVGEGTAQALPVEGLSEGQTLTLTYSGNRRVRSVKAIVVPAEAAVKVTAITLNKTATTIEVGNNETLSVSSITPDNATDQTVTWSSDNAAVASVDALTGEVTAVATGTANITATANDGSGVTATCAVTVAPAISFSKQAWYAMTDSSTAPANFISVSQTDAKAAADAEKTRANAPGYVCIYALEGGSYKWFDSHGRSGQGSIEDIANGDAWDEVYECNEAGDSNSIWFTVSQ